MKIEEERLRVTEEEKAYERALSKKHKDYCKKLIRMAEEVSDMAMDHCLKNEMGHSDVILTMEEATRDIRRRILGMVADIAENNVDHAYDEPEDDDPWPPIT